jgi:hypothetical protein
VLRSGLGRDLCPLLFRETWCTFCVSERSVVVFWVRERLVALRAGERFVYFPV